VRFLDARGRIAGHNQIDISNADGRSAIAPEQSDRFQVAILCGFKRAFNILGFSASRNRDEDVTRFPVGRDLPRKDFFEAIIVSDRREQAATLGKIERGKGPAIMHKTTGKLRTEIGRVGRAPTIPADEHFISRLQTFHDQVRRAL
jgi:hypothetical protein